MHHAKLKKHSLKIALITLAAGISLAGVLIQQAAEPASAATCSTGFAVNVSGSTTTTPVSGIVNATLGLPTTTTTSIAKVIFRANGQPIGRAQPANTYSWSMPWMTNLSANGSALFDAEVFFSGTTASCTTQGVPVNIYNSTAAALNALSNPQSWSGPMSYSFPVNIKLKAGDSTTFDPTPYALYEWSTSIGSINPSNNVAQYFSGQTVGTGAITVQAIYGGRRIPISVPVTVASSNTPIPSTTTTTTTKTTNSTTTATGAQSSTTDTKTTTTTSQPTIAAIPNSDVKTIDKPNVHECLVATIGEARFAQINSGEARPTTEEIKKFNVCFAISNYVLPANFAPVAPTAIKTLSSVNELRINNLENVPKASQGTTTTANALKITGIAKPNSVVIIYIFSDPLVLTTIADANGNWSYTLEDPIEPGKHEVYSTVDRGDGTYERSKPFSFIIGTAEAAALNPDGLSLQLKEEPTPRSNTGMVLYIVASGVVLAALLGAFFVVIRHQNRKKTSPVSTPESVLVPSTQSVNPTTSAPQEANPAQTNAPNGQEDHLSTPAEDSKPNA